MPRLRIQHARVGVGVVWGAASIWALVDYWEWPWTGLSAYSLGVLSVALVLLLIRSPSALAAAASESWLVRAGRWAFRGAAIVAATLVVVGVRIGAIGAGTKACSAVTNPEDPGQFRDLLACARSQPYDSLSHMAMDEDWLAIKDTVRRDSIVVVRGPRARIIPEKRSYLNSVEDLAGAGRGHGLVLVKIWVDPTFADRQGRRGYPKLNLPPGVSYVFFDNLRVTGDSGTARAIIIPDDENGRVTVHRGRVTYYRWQRAEKRSRASWIWDPAVADEAFNAGGCPMGCCNVY
jgi:hypothetical protein